jgi:hypothetical protein
MAGCTLTFQVTRATRRFQGVTGGDLTYTETAVPVFFGGSGTVPGMTTERGEITGTISEAGDRILVPSKFLAAAPNSRLANAAIIPAVNRGVFTDQVDGLSALPRLRPTRRRSVHHRVKLPRHDRCWGVFQDLEFSISEMRVLR